MRRRLDRKDGFTLPGALVAMVMAVGVLLALYTVFDASVRVFGAVRGQRRGSAGAAPRRPGPSPPGEDGA